MNPDFEHVSEMGHHNPEHVSGTQYSDVNYDQRTHGVIIIHPIPKHRTYEALNNNDNSKDFPMKWRIEETKDQYGKPMPVGHILLKQLDAALRTQNMTRDLADTGIIRINGKIAGVDDITTWYTVRHLQRIIVDVHPLR